MNNAQILEFLRTVPYNLTYDAENGKLSGSGNCALPILSSDGNFRKMGFVFVRFTLILPKTVLSDIILD